MYGSVSAARAVKFGEQAAENVVLRATVKRQAAEIARLKLQVAEAQRNAAGWQRKWQLAYSADACPTFDAIVKLVCDEFGVEKVDVLSDRRCLDLTPPRHVAMYLCARKTRRSYPVIGKYFRRDHSTIQQNCRRLAAKMEKDAALASRVKALAEKVDAK